MPTESQSVDKVAEVEKEIQQKIAADKPKEIPDTYVFRKGFENQRELSRADADLLIAYGAKAMAEAEESKNTKTELETEKVKAEEALETATTDKQVAIAEKRLKSVEDKIDRLTGVLESQQSNARIANDILRLTQQDGFIKENPEYTEDIQQQALTNQLMSPRKPTETCFKEAVIKIKKIHDSVIAKYAKQKASDTVNTKGERGNGTDQVIDIKDKTKANDLIKGGFSKRLRQAVDGVRFNRS